MRFLPTDASISPPAPKTKLNPRRKVSAKADPASLTSNLESLSVGEASPEPAKKKSAPPPEKKESPLASMDVLVSHEAELYQWDSPTEEFTNQGILTASIVKHKNAGYQYWLTATNDIGFLLSHKIEPEMNQRFSHKMNTLTWNHQADDGSQNSWLFRFNDGGFAEFLNKFTECLWETLHQTAWSKAKVLDLHPVIFIISHLPRLKSRIMPSVRTKMSKCLT